VRLVKQRKVGCAYVAVRRGWKYAHLEVDLIDCKAQGLETLGVVRDVARLLYDRVISRSEAWARALLDHPVAGRHVISQLLEFIERGEVTYTGGVKYPHVPLYFFENPRVWTSAGQYRVVVVAERSIVEDAVAEVERLLEERLLEHMPGSLGGGSGGGPGPSQG
jgi:hypothetical protein